MSVIWAKVWSDLWDNKVRTILAVLSIAAGVFAVGAAFGMSDQLLDAMDDAHQASVPTHFTLSLSTPVTTDLVDDLKNIAGVEDIALGSFETTRYKTNLDDEWQAAWVVSREDFEEQIYELLPLKAGEWPNRRRIGVERLTSQHNSINIGDTIYFEIDDRPKAREVAGVMRHNFVPPPQFGGPGVFFMDADAMTLLGIPKGQFDQIIVRVTPYSRELAQDVASEIKDRLSSEGIGVAITIYQDPEEHWGRSIMAGINLVLQVMAAVSLGASVVLVLNTLMAIVTQQTNQIGILKAIGGTQLHIVRIYLISVFVYGILSLLIALPAGAWLAYIATWYLLDIFNIDYDVFQFSTTALILQAVAAIAVPVLAGLWPILRGTAITVREAVSSYGLGGDFGSNKFDQTIERIGRFFLSTPYAVALGNMFRRKGRLILTQIVLSLAGSMFLAVMSLSASLDLTLDNVLARQSADLFVIFDGDERVDYALEVAYNHPGVEYAEMWFQTGASILKEGQRLQDAGIGAVLVGIPNGSTLFQPDIMFAGRWLQPGDGPAIIIRKDVAEDNGLWLGDTVRLDLGQYGDDDWQIIGIYQQVFGGGVGETTAIYANLDAVARATKQYNSGDELRIQTQHPNEVYVDSVGKQLSDIFEARNIDIADTETIIQLRRDIDTQFDIVVNMLLAVAVITAMVGGVGLMGALSISVVERTREIGVMRAVGAKTGTILGMFMMEGILQGILSWAIIVPISIAIGRPLSNALGQVLFQASLDYQYNVESVGIWFVVMLIISTLASILPARSATSISVRDSLAYS